MIEHTLDTSHSNLYVRPKFSLEKSDFVDIARTIDPYITDTGGLTGLIIDVYTFPGWESLGAMTRAA